MKAFNLQLGTTVFRLYLMMLVVIVAGFSGFWSLAFLALPIFLFTLLGIGFKVPDGRAMRKSLTQHVMSMIENLHLPMHHTT